MKHKIIIIGGGPVLFGAEPPGGAPGLRKDDGARVGGAIMAAKGSLAFSVFCSFSACGSFATADVGGGPTGFAFSSGSSPGNTQTLRFSS